jgi:uncharacterized protein
MSLDNKAIAYAAQNTNLPINKVISTCNLLFIEECTIPFISRYRKEVTGSLDEVQIRSIQDSYNEYIEIEKRRSYILETIDKMKMLTPLLKEKIEQASTLNTLEDLYAPYKSKKKTKAQLAKEKGLQGLSDFILTSPKSIKEDITALTERFIKGSQGQVKDWNEAIAGATDIITEMISHDPDLKDELRNVYWSDGIITSALKKGAEKIATASKYKDFFEYTEKVKELKNPKNTHRYLAMRRGMGEKVLKIDITIPKEIGLSFIEARYYPQDKKLGNRDAIAKISEKAFDTVLTTSLDLEIKTELKKIADSAAIDVFGINLKNLLLQPYLGSKAVLGIDPGIRTGCKVVIVDSTGKFIGDHVIYPFAPKFDTNGSKQILEKMIEMFDIKHIAIGNGTNGRETLAFVQENIQAVSEGKVEATMINEAGASIYSASDIAREEFPDKDVTVRGAVSIARRFQDPLAELVKIDPKSIGVGQYQHDVNQARLKKSLTAIVEDCVNYVGVDLNTASAPLLSYISGIGPSVSKNIVKHRDKNGVFKTRQDLLKVARFSDKVFTQAAGFLRIYNGENPLDSTFIHPEKYQIIMKWVKDKNHDLNSLVENKKLQEEFSKDMKLKNELGAETFKDIVSSLMAPTQDPRETFKSVEFRKDVKSIDDLVVGEWYTGVVNNITNFGAFVDIGIKQSGLLHISQISDEFIDNPLDKLKVGEVIKAQIIEIDKDRGRISLSRKTGERAHSENFGKKSQSKKTKSQNEFKNNPFAKLLK